MIEKYKKNILEIINSYAPGSTVYLFGSRARNTHDLGSDLDLALDAGKKISLDDILSIKEAIEETTLPLFVDVVDMHAIDTDLKKEILKDGIVWIS